MPDATQGFDFDVVIVGASFAGAACAIAAAQRGLRVCVLERKRDPGDKLRTTGIIVKEAAERTLLHRLPAPITRRIESVRLYAPSLKQVALAAPGYYFLTTDTPAAMRWLAGHLREHGVDLLGELPQPVAGLRPQRHLDAGGVLQVEVVTAAGDLDDAERHGRVVAAAVVGPAEVRVGGQVVAQGSLDEWPSGHDPALLRIWVRESFAVRLSAACCSARSTACC